jgi:mannose-6-phosphate isomerase-like protein (cupin superfamily)
MTCVINKEELPIDGFAWEFQGYHYGDTNVSFIIVEAQPGDGPKLHSHPYAEVFIIQEGQVTFTVGTDRIESTAGQIVIAPAGVPHKFINSGIGTLRQIDIHASPRFITTWYAEIPARQDADIGR